jgi:LacI family transcriptional regulator
VAVFAANDHFARHLVEQCGIAGIRVPQECAVLGVGADSYICELVDPPISSVSLGFRQAGYQAAQALDQQMRDGQVVGQLITATAGQVVLRRSTDAIAVTDPVLAHALQYLLEHSYRAVEVDDVAAHVGVSRRNLENRFRKGMDTSVLKYHRSLRAEHIAQVLLESKLSLEAISEQCGFSEPGNLTRFFKSVKGESPSAFCKRMHG